MFFKTSFLSPKLTKLEIFGAYLQIKYAYNGSFDYEKITYIYNFIYCIGTKKSNKYSEGGGEKFTNCPLDIVVDQIQSQMLPRWRSTRSPPAVIMPATGHLDDCHHDTNSYVVCAQIQTRKDNLCRSECFCERFQ